MSDWIKFLGTAGARFVVARQLRASGGAWLHFGDCDLFLDPGPGALVRCLSSKPKLDPSKLDAIILTHSHIDHSCDVNIMIEAMTDGGHKKRGVLFTTRESMEEDPVVREYLRDWVDIVVVMEAGRSYALGDLTFTTPVRHIHPVETYGLRFPLKKGTLSFVIDTQYFDELVDAYRADVVVMNVVRVDPIKELQHLCLADAKHLIEQIKPKTAVLTHFGMTMVRAKPWELAAKLSQETGVNVIAARDGMTLELDDYFRQAGWKGEPGSSARGNVAPS